MGKYDEARLVYHELSMNDSTMAQHYRLSCDYAEHLISTDQKYSIVAFEHNSAENNFALRAKNNQLYWMNQVTANHNLDENKLCPVVAQNKVNNPMPDFRRDDIIPVSENVNCFMMCDLASSERSVYMHNNNGYNHAIINDHTNTFLTIENYSGSKSTLVAFPFNSMYYSMAYPQLADNGQVLYFSSNKPGGFGGFDIYISEFNEGAWSEPINLGPVVNSKGDEITPFFEGNSLYFASNYLHGLGGYDIFKSESYNGKFTFPSNVGAGINSPQDDVYPFFQADSGKLYFSSNRSEGLGGFDIYVGHKNIQYEVAYLNEKNNSGQKIYEDLPSYDSNKAQSRSATPVAMDENSEWIGAVMGGFDESLFNGTPVFFIQLAAMSNSKPEADSYRALAKYGNIYVMNVSNTSKIRLGYFFDEHEAREVLTTIKGKGFKDAFITSLPLDMKELEVLVSNSSYKTDSYMVPKKFKGTSEYKVRLASYENPKWFNIEKAKDIGKIEQWSKGGWTIFVLAGFKSQDEAVKARVKAINKGFVDAEVVFDNNGMLEKIKRN
jgi:hypothetical protein